MFRWISPVTVLLLPLALDAQWPSYPTKHTDLTAPAPKTAEGKPDFTGIWRNSQPARLGDFGDRIPTRDPNTPLTGLEMFADIGTGMKDGLPLQAWAAELKKKRMADFSKDNPDAHCLPMGNMQFETHPQPRKMIQTPDLLLIVYEANGGLRQIFLDGRPLPKADDVQPWWYGYSVGKWDGDTLLVETTRFRDDGWLDINGSPLTSSAKMTERFRRPDFGNLEIQITVDDPTAYTKPWSVTVRQKIWVDTELIEFICNEGERDAVHLVGK